MSHLGLTIGMNLCTNKAKRPIQTCSDSTYDYGVNSSNGSNGTGIAIASALYMNQPSVSTGSFDQGRRKVEFMSDTVNQPLGNGGFSIFANLNRDVYLKRRKYIDSGETNAMNASPIIENEVSYSRTTKDNFLSSELKIDKCVESVKCNIDGEKHCINNKNKTSWHKCSKCDKSFPCISYLQKHWDIKHTNKKQSSSSFSLKHSEVELMPDAVDHIVDKEQLFISDNINIKRYLANDGNIDSEDNDSMSMYFDTKAMDSYSETSEDDVLSSEAGTSKSFGNIGLQQNLSNENNSQDKYVCETCKKESSNKSNLKLHMNRVHHKTKIYKCSDCSMRSYYEDNVKAHWKRKHDREHIRAKCPECKASYASPEGLISHMNKVHPNIFLYKCPNCQKGFNLQRNLKQHLVRVHDKKVMYNCLACNKTFYKRYLLTRHNDSKKHRKKAEENAINFGCQEDFLINTPLKKIMYTCVEGNKTINKAWQEKHNDSASHKRAAEKYKENSLCQDSSLINKPLKSCLYTCVECNKTLSKASKKRHNNSASHKVEVEKCKMNSGYQKGSLINTPLKNGKGMYTCVECNKTVADNEKSKKNHNMTAMHLLACKKLRVTDKV